MVCQNDSAVWAIGLEPALTVGMPTDHACAIMVMIACGCEQNQRSPTQRNYSSPKGPRQVRKRLTGACLELHSTNGRSSITSEATDVKAFLLVVLAYLWRGKACLDYDPKRF
jgi:hypothetical protein